MALEHVLISMDLDADGYALTAINIGRLPYLLDLTAEAGRKFRVIRRGCWNP
ncbi:hypothetical protein ABZ319_09600 [Nocardia sp. NPDC005978]|uniref:hypothetical protein n=1 Tax=Nocardia sp. NPDC005978 TaxID=3156725 RepID=UPI0033B3898E